MQWSIFGIVDKVLLEKSLYEIPMTTFNKYGVTLIYPEIATHQCYFLFSTVHAHSHMSINTSLPQTSFNLPQYLLIFLFPGP